MSGTGNLIVQTRDNSQARAVLAELVQAWARDVATGEPRHILELGKANRGAKSGCECPSCGLPLTAVNAAKTEFVKRPHFRHPEGAARDECMLLAARAAAMRQLHDEGWLDLPRRRMSARAIGISGEAHEAWVELPPERVRITDVDFRDRVAAVLTLEDGRQLRVELTGTLGGESVPALDSAGHPIPTILLAVDDPALAGMAPDELRRRLKLLPDALCWRSHWRDDDLAEQALISARDKALLHFDEIPEGLHLPEDLAPALKRQTVLHYAVMMLLAESKYLRVPGWTAEAAATWPDGRIVRRKAVSVPELLNVDQVDLEKRFGNIVPDVTCKAWPIDGGEVFWPLFIEVTVTNHIDSARLDRIREAGMPTLEVDLSLTGGRIDREGLRSLVIDGIEIKRWLFHPEHARRVNDLQHEIGKEAAAAEAISARRAELLATPIADLAYRYLDAAIRLADAESIEDSDGHRSPSISGEIRDARAAMADVVEALDVHGYPEAGDANLIGTRGIICRLLSIQYGRPIGYRLANVAGVLNAIEQSKGTRKSEASIYFIAVRAYKPQLTEAQQTWFERWTAEVRESLRAGEKTYLRDPSYDRLLSLLFPEMSAGLARSGGKRRLEDAPAHGDWKSAKWMGVPTRQRAEFLEPPPRMNDKQRHLVSTGGGDDWLKGQDLEEWKKAYPESARRWFGK
ncbi:hypothetical protein [Aquabacterium sp.]|uniref:hypothetical protein n=1 Tax=Aquabacterium sp. TaxID=1872578 RepID=UPI00403766D2